MAKKKPRQRPGKRSKKAAKPGSKTSTVRSRLLAILIAVIFWSVVWGLMSLRNRSLSTARENRNRTFQTRHFLREIENALAQYKEARGTVPLCVDEERGAEVLFTQLLAGQRRYLGPQPDRIRHGKEEGDASVIIDAWDHPIRYRTGAPPGKQVTANPDYDLWSTGGDPGNPRQKWITP